MWHLALESWQWIHQVAAPCNVIRGFEFAQTSAILLFYMVSISTTSLQSTCHSAPVCEILSKSDHPRQKKMTSCRFSRWRISAILDFRGPIMVLWKAHVLYDFLYVVNRDHSSKLLSFWENRMFCTLATDRQTNKQTDIQAERRTAPTH